MSNTSTMNDNPPKSISSLRKPTQGTLQNDIQDLEATGRSIGSLRRMQKRKQIGENG